LLFPSCSGIRQEHLTQALDQGFQQATADEFHEVFEEFMREQEQQQQQQQTDNG